MTPDTCTKASNDTVLLVEFTYYDSQTIALVGDGWDAEMNGNPTIKAVGTAYYGLTFRDNSYLSLKQQGTLDMQSFTIEVVAKSKSYSPQPYLSMKNSLWMPEIAEDGTIGFTLCVARATNAGCEDKWEINGLHPPDGVDVAAGVHHYALSYDSTQRTVSLFVDGALVDTRKTPEDKPYIATPPNNRIRVGGPTDSNKNITVYTVRLSNRAKSAKDIITSRICKMLL